MNSTKDLFDNTVGIKEVLNKKQLDAIVNAIIDTRVKYVIFSSITYGWKEIVEKLKERNKEIKIKFLWHGSHAMFVERDESYFLTASAKASTLPDPSSSIDITRSNF